MYGNLMICQNDIERDRYYNLFILSYFYKLYADDSRKKNIKTTRDDIINFNEVMKSDPYYVYKQAKLMCEIIEQNTDDFYKRLVENIHTNFINDNIKKSDYRKKPVQ